MHRNSDSLPAVTALSPLFKKGLFLFVLGLAAGLALAETGTEGGSNGAGGVPLWEAGAFAGGLSAPAYPASEDRSRNALVLPFFIYRGEILHADQSGVGAHLVEQEKFALEMDFSGSPPVGSDSIPLRQGMPDLAPLLEVGPRVKLQIARPAPGHSVYAEFPLRYVIEVRSGLQTQGFTMAPKIHYEYRPSAEWNLRGGAGFYYGDQKLNQYFFGVPAEFATATRPEFLARGGLISTRLSLDLSFSASRDVRIYAYVRHENYMVSANRDSPLFAQSSANTLGVAMTWTLGRSDTLVRRSSN